MVFQVTQAYLEVLRQQEALAVARQELERAEGNLRLAQGQLEVGSGTPLDTRQAEVAVGRARVSVLVSENAVRTAGGESGSVRSYADGGRAEAH